MRHITIKEKATEVKGTYKYSMKNHSPVCFSLKSFSLTDLSIEGSLANATLACYSSTQFILQVSSNKDDPNHCFVHPLQRGAQLLIFYIISNIDETIDKGLAKPLEVVEYGAIFLEVEAL